MIRDARKIFSLGGAVCVGYLIVPLIVSAISSLGPLTTTNTGINAAYRLFDALARYRPEPVPLSLTNDTMAKDCGYQSDQLFSASDKLVDGPRWTPSTGYFDLTLWVSNEFAQEVKRGRVEQLKHNLSDYSLRFLDHCIRETAFASVCANRAWQAFGEGGHASLYTMPTGQLRPDQRRRFNTVCTYLDGLAARRGIMLSNVVRSGRWPDYR
jgi:hypothetical protein